MNVTEIREAKVVTCPTCKGAMLPTPSGKWSCMKMCGPLKTLADARAQRRSLAIVGECRGEDVGVSLDKEWVAFVLSLPIARKTIVGKKTAWELGGVSYRRGSKVEKVREFGPDAIYAVLAPRTQMRVTTLIPFEQPREKKSLTVEAGKD